MSFIEAVRIAALGFAAVFVSLMTLALLLGLFGRIIRSCSVDSDTQAAAAPPQKARYSRPTDIRAVYRVRVNDTVFTAQVEEVHKINHCEN
jgi:Na+-transporting methylmalonyl-CoA/oxaloacetate decarboxylase gamma subunit